MSSSTAFLFPGQGSQSEGMMAELAETHPLIVETFGEASQALGYDLWGIVSGGPEERLNQTEVTQPAMLAADIATWRVWRAMGGPRPDYMAGHSLGEYAALVAADSIDFDAAVRLVAQRGKLMQEATPEGSGAMAAILGLDDDQVREACRAAAQGQVVSCANFNSPGQVVIAGHSEAVDRACEAARQAGARRALILPVSVPSHCELMKGAAEVLESALDDTDVRPPAIPVYHNVDTRARQDADDVRAALAAQIWQPVMWADTMRHFTSMGVSHTAECGPGKVLAGLGRRISRETACAALTDMDTIQNTIDEWSTP